MRTRPRRSATRGLSAAIVLIGLALSFAFGGFNLVIFFIALAIASLVGPLSIGNPRALYGGLYGFFWMLMLALFFATNSWYWFLVGAAISVILGSFSGPIIAALAGWGIFGMANQQPYYQPQQPYYQPQQQEPYYQPPQEPPPSYEQGYQQAPQQPETYQEGGEQHQYPPQYEQPQAQYPQQMPPQQQQ